MPLIQGQIANANTPTTVVTVGASETVEVFQIELHSVAAVNQTILIFFVPNNAGAVGTATIENRKESFVLEAGESLTLVAPKAPWKYSGENDTIQIESSQAAALNYFIITAVDGVL